MAKVQAAEKTIHPTGWGKPVEQYNAVEIIQKGLDGRRFALNEEVQVMTTRNHFTSGKITYISLDGLDLEPRGGAPVTILFHEIEDITYWR